MDIKPSIQLTIAILTGLGKITRDEAGMALDVINRELTGMELTDYNINRVVDSLEHERVLEDIRHTNDT